MPRYYFHVRDGAYFPDEEGTELPNLISAQNTAVASAGAMLQDDAEQFWKGQEWHMDVTDRSGLILFSLTFVASKAPSITAIHD